MQRTYHRQRDPTAEVCQDDDGDLGLEALLAALRRAVPVNMSPGACKPPLDEEITERYEREAAAVEQGLQSMHLAIYGGHAAVAELLASQRAGVAAAE